MKFLKTALKVLTIAALFLGAAYYILVNHSATGTALTCSGKWEKGPEGLQGTDETVYAVLEEYRPWIVWTDSDGDLKAESKNFAFRIYVSDVKKIGDKPLVTYMFPRDPGGKIAGGYRAAPKELTLRFTDDLLFVGACTEGAVFVDLNRQRAAARHRRFDVTAEMVGPGELTCSAG
jgi:hypothetical protein